MTANPFSLLHFLTEALRNCKKVLCRQAMLSKDRIHSRNGNVSLENPHLPETVRCFFPFAGHSSLYIVRYKHSF